MLYLCQYYYTDAREASRELYTRMLHAVLNKSWKQEPTKR